MVKEDTKTGAEEIKIDGLSAVCNVHYMRASFLAAPTGGAVRVLDAPIGWVFSNFNKMVEEEG